MPVVLAHFRSPLHQPSVDTLRELHSLPVEWYINKFASLTLEAMHIETSLYLSRFLTIVFLVVSGRLWPTICPRVDCLHVSNVQYLYECVGHE